MTSRQSDRLRTVSLDGVAWGVLDAPGVPRVDVHAASANAITARAAFISFVRLVIVSLTLRVDRPSRGRASRTVVRARMGRSPRTFSALGRAHPCFMNSRGPRAATRRGKN